MTSLAGQVAYGLTNGRKVSIDFAARLVFGEGADAMKLVRYQVSHQTGPFARQRPANSIMILQKGLARHVCTCCGAERLNLLLVLRYKDRLHCNAKSSSLPDCSVATSV